MQSFFALFIYLLILFILILLLFVNGLFIYFVFQKIIFHFHFIHLEITWNIRTFKKWICRTTGLFKWISDSKKINGGQVHLRS